MSNKIVPSVYRTVIDQVISSVRLDFDELAVDEEILALLQQVSPHPRHHSLRCLCSLYARWSLPDRMALSDVLVPSLSLPLALVWLFRNGSRSCLPRMSPSLSLPPSSSCSPTTRCTSPYQARDSTDTSSSSRTSSTASSKEGRDRPTEEHDRTPPRRTDSSSQTEATSSGTEDSGEERTEERTER